MGELAPQVALAVGNRGQILQRALRPLCSAARCSLDSEALPSMLGSDLLWLLLNDPSRPLALSACPGHRVSLRVVAASGCSVCRQARGGEGGQVAGSLT